MGKKTPFFIGLFLVVTASLTAASSRTLWDEYIKKGCELQVINSEQTIFEYNSTGSPLFQPLIAYKSSQSSVNIITTDGKKLSLDNHVTVPWWRLMQATFDLDLMKVNFRVLKDDPIELQFKGGASKAIAMSITAKEVWVTKGNCVSENGELPYEIVKSQSKSEITHLLPLTGETDFLIFTEKKHSKSNLRIASYYGDLDICLTEICGALSARPLGEREVCGPLMSGFPHWLKFVYDRNERKYGINSYMYEIGRSFSFDNLLGASTEEYYIVRCLTQCHRNENDHPKYDIIAEECQMEMIIVAILVLVVAVVERHWNLQVLLNSLPKRKKRGGKMKKEEEKKGTGQTSLQPQQLQQNPQALPPSPSGSLPAEETPPPPQEK